MEDLERLKKLAGINEPKEEDGSMGENLSLIGTKKADLLAKSNLNEIYEIIGLTKFT